MKWSIGRVGLKLKWGHTGPGTKCGARSHSKALPSPTGVNTARLSPPGELSWHVWIWSKAGTVVASLGPSPLAFQTPLPGPHTLGK